MLDSTRSTSSTLAERAAELAHGAVIATREQTAGRGQRGNSWEAEPGKNLTFSILLKPHNIPAAEAFSLSMLTAIAIADFLSERLPGQCIKIKWPNDIYAGDLKICGILHENAFAGGTFEHSIAGIGINVNQTIFMSDAPNPVSMAMLAKHEFDVDELLGQITAHILEVCDSYDGDAKKLTAHYRTMLWRGEGEYLWLDHLTGETIHAAIASVAPDGTFTLATTPPRSYAFKEISPIFE
jgi:BirA family biotin operon repressor/biotin-[acetyl-CoA-carboxylase] ligase